MLASTYEVDLYNIVVASRNPDPEGLQLQPWLLEAVTTARKLFCDGPFDEGTIREFFTEALVDKLKKAHGTDV